MRKASVFVNNHFAGILEELAGNQYCFCYDPGYDGIPVSMTMPVKQSLHEFSEFPPFFEGVLPEGIQLDVLLRKYKLDRDDYFGQLLQVGHDLVGAVTVEELS